MCELFVAVFVIENVAWPLAFLQGPVLVIIFLFRCEDVLVSKAVLEEIGGSIYLSWGYCNEEHDVCHMRLTECVFLYQPGWSMT